MLALGVLGDPAHKAAGPIGVGVRAGRLCGEVLTKIHQGIMNVGIRRQPTLPAGSLVGFRLRFPFELHGGFAGLGQIVGSGLAVVGLLG